MMVDDRKGGIDFVAAWENDEGREGAEVTDATRDGAQYLHPPIAPLRARTPAASAERTTAMVEAELQRLKLSLEPVVLGPESVTLHDAYVPRGPETLTSADTEASALKPDEPDVVDVGSNRYSGVIYASRFFVTRVGFLRSVKQIMVLSSHHLTIVDPYTDEVKERYAYDNIKEIMIASDSGGGGSNVDRGFTIFIGKNIREKYTCRYRQQLLSTYYQLRERASSMRRDGLDVPTAPALNMLPGMSAPVGLPTAPLPGAQGAGGMYFDSLFQLCGKTFTVKKLSSTKSTSLSPVKIDVLLAVRASSLDRLHTETRATLSSILLIDIVKIQRVTTNSNELVVYFENNRVHRYWCDAREPFIQAIANNLRSWLNVTLFVEEVSDSCEFDALTSTRDIPQPVAFEIPVLKISKNSKNKMQLRLLALTSTAVIERDPETRRTLASHSLNDIFNVVMYPSLSSSSEGDDETEGTCGKFALELKHGRTRRFVCLSATVARRDKDVGLGLERATDSHEQQLRQVIGDVGADATVPEWLNVAGSSTLLSPKESRSLFLCNMIEMCRMNKLHVSWSTEETRVGCKEGTWGSELHPELEEIFLRKLVNLTLIPNLVTKDSLESTFRQLEQFNRNVPVGSLRQRDRRAFAALMKLLENFKEYAVSQLSSPSNSDSPVPTAEFQVAILLAIQRMLCTRAVFEEVPNSQYRKGIEIIMELLHSPMEEVSFAAASVIKYMVINYSETRSMKSEQVNRRAVFTKYHCRLFVSRAFDLSKTNRVGRVPRQNLLQYRTGSLDLSHLDDGSTTRSERSMASALSYSQMGLDYLVIALVLQTLEVCLSSGKKASPEGVVTHLLRAMKIDEFMRHHTLFLFNRSLSFSISKCSSIMVKVHVLEQASELVELIQDAARKHGALLWQLYLALYANDKAQRRISSQLVALLTHENARSSAVIRNIFPHALLDDIPVQQLEYDEFGRSLPAVTSEMVARSGPASPRRRSYKTAMSMDGTNATESGRSRISYGITTRSRLVKNAKCVVLLPEFFDRLWKSYSSKDLMWGQNAVEELIHKLELEIASLDIARLRYQYYLYTDPLGGERAETEWALAPSHEERHPARQPYPFEFLHSGSESRLAQEVMRGTVSSSNKFAQYMPISFLVTPDMSDAGDSDRGEDDNGETDDEDESAPPVPASTRRSSLKPTDLIAVKAAAPDAVAANGVDAKLKKKRKRRAKVVPRWYVSWNANEFRVDYDCLRDEVKVGAYYLTNLLNDRGVLVEDIPGADKFMTLLYYRLLAEEESHTHGDETTRDSSTPSPFTDVDSSDIRLLVLKVMIQLYERHYTELSSLLFLNHLLRVSMMTQDHAGGHKWPLVVRGNIVLLLDRVLSSAANVSRFLRVEENVQMVLDLLREVKPLVLSHDEIEGDSDYGIDESDAEFDPSGEDEEFDDDIDSGDHYDEGDTYDEEYVDADDGGDVDDIARRTLNALEASGVESSLITTPTLSPSQVEQPDTPHEDRDRRFTVVAEHSGSMSGSMMMQTCLSVLSRLIDCHTAEDEGNLYQDIKFPKYGRLIHFEGTAVSPASQIKNRLCQDETLRFLVSLLDCPNRVVFKKCLGLIRLLVRHNEAIIPRLHATGLFYYLLRFAEDADEMAVAARLISHIHLRQSKPDVPDPVFDRQGGENKKGIFSPDPLTQICLKSWLVRLLPVSMVAQLLRHGPRRFAQALFSESNNPEVVWNTKMRSQMVTYIEKFMARHVDNSGIFHISGEEDVDHEACIALIQYPREVHALQCYQYYLHNLLDEKHFPGWPVNDEEAFLDALMDAIKYWVHPETGRYTKRDADQKTLSVKDATLLLDSTALLLRRFPDSVAITNFKNLGYILEALEKCILDLRDGDTRGSRRTINISDAITKKSAVVQAFGSAIRVINLATALSEENSIECSSGIGLRGLCGSLQLLFDNQEALGGLKNFDVQVTTHWVLEALVSVLNQPNGRVSAAAQSLDLLPCLTRFLRQDEDQLATDLSLQIIIQMATSSGEMAEVLLLQLAEHGILWYLTLLLFRFQPTPGIEGEDPDRISIGAAKALEQILRATAKEESISVFVKRMQDTIESLFTRPLIDYLCNSGPITFLNVLVSEVRRPHIMWTERMRKELIDVAQRAVHFHSTLDRSGRELHKVYELPNNFMYAAQKEELCVAGIYVNFFNESPQDGLEEQIAGTVNPPMPAMPEKTVTTVRRITGRRAATPAEPEKRSVAGHVMHGLLTALSNDLAGVRVQPSALEAVLLNRMLPVATSIRHLIQFIPDMDIQVVHADGIVTLLNVLDHEAQPQGFSFASAPLLQLRCIECLHMLSFSGKCLDSLATQVPPFVKSLFQIVYKHLTKTDASTEGQLARITLQFLGNLCLIPACVDNMVKGMDPVALSNVLPNVWSGEPGEVQLLLCLHMIPLKRHTQAATQFAKASINSQLAATLLSLLSTLVPKSKLNEISQTKSYAARFLSVLSSNPGSGGAIASLLVSSRVWETYGDTTQGSADDLRRLLVPPYAPSLLKADHANPQKIG